MMPLYPLVANFVLGLSIASAWPVLAGQTTPNTIREDPSRDRC